MASKATRQGKADGVDSFAVYRDGGTTTDIRLTVLLLLVGRRWRSLLDEKLRPTGQVECADGGDVGDHQFAARSARRSISPSACASKARR